MTRTRSLLALAALAALGLAAAPGARADTPFIINSLNPGDVTLTATGDTGSRTPPVTLTASDNSNTATLTGSDALSVSDGTGLGFSDAGTFGTTVVEYTSGGFLPFSALEGLPPPALTLTFTQPVTEFGFYLEDASVGLIPAISFPAPAFARVPNTPNPDVPPTLGTFTFVITGSDGTVTPLTETFTDESPFFFGAQRSLNTPGISIKSVAISGNAAGAMGQDFFLGPVKVMTAAPEPSQTVALALGGLCLGGLALRAARRPA